MRPRSRIVARFTAALSLLVASAALGEARRFDRVAFTPAEGWSVEQRGDELVQLARIDGGGYCMLVVYASTPARGDLAQSFASEWRDVVLKSIDPVDAPSPTIGDVGNTRAATGGTLASIKGAPTAAVLVVLDAAPNVVSIVILSSSGEALERCTGGVQAMLASLTVDRSAPPAAPAAPGGKLVIPPPARPLTLADLAGDWQHEDRISTTYVDRSSGAYAGSDNLAFRDSYTIGAKGTIFQHFFAIRNGKKIVEDTTGTIRISPAGVIDIKIGGNPRYVVRGWLVLPAMTVLKLNGPHYGEIEPRILADPQYGTNLDQLWVRKAKAPPPPK